VRRQAQGSRLTQARGRRPCLLLPAHPAQSL